MSTRTDKATESLDNLLPDDAGAITEDFLSNILPNEEYDDDAGNGSSSVHKKSDNDSDGGSSSTQTPLSSFGLGSSKSTNCSPCLSSISSSVHDESNIALEALKTPLTKEKLSAVTEGSADGSTSEHTSSDMVNGYHYSPLTDNTLITIVSSGSSISVLNDCKNDDDHKCSPMVKEKRKGTMQQWLDSGSLQVHPIWIGNLPLGTNVNDLRKWIEGYLSCILVSIHINAKQQSTDEKSMVKKRTYAFINLPTAETQMCAQKQLDSQIYNGAELIVRYKKPSNFSQSFFSSPISEDFRRFKDSVLPQISNNKEVNSAYFQSILEENDININLLPHRIWCVKCSLMPNCHRNYCSFFHNPKQKQYGRIIQLLTNQQSNNKQLRITNEQQFHQKGNRTLAVNGTVLSRHTLLIQGMSSNTKQKKVEDTFNVYGEISSVITDEQKSVFYVRMKRNLDARKIVYLYQFDQSGMKVSFAVNGKNSKKRQKKEKKRNRKKSGHTKICKSRPMLSAIHYSHCLPPSNTKLIDNRPPLIHSNSQKASAATVSLHRKVECEREYKQTTNVKKIHEYEHQPSNDTPQHHMYHYQPPPSHYNNCYYQSSAAVVNHRQIFHQRQQPMQQRMYHEYYQPSVPQQYFHPSSVSNSASMVDSHSVSMMKSNTTFYGYPTYAPKYASPMHSVPHQSICSSPANTPFEEEMGMRMQTPTYVRYGPMFINPPPPPTFYTPQLQQQRVMDECAYATGSVFATDSELQFTIGDHQRMNSSANVSTIQFTDFVDNYGQSVSHGSIGNHHQR